MLLNPNNMSACFLTDWCPTVRGSVATASNHARRADFAGGFFSASLTQEVMPTAVCCFFLLDMHEGFKVL